ncbi:MAG: hypothetical protein B6D59_04845 [Campylobacteraceae bacterium 4484_4]|nr:MAG: hypothetical protein B6D59_04845 [Campylobacteraceae bacterium 4484_4]
MKTAAKKVAQKVEKKGAEAAATAVNDDILIFQADNSDGKITPETIQEAFEKSGFYIAANNNMNIPYKRDFNNTYYDVYNLAAYYNKDIVAQFIKEYPKIGLFAPISMSIYTKKGDKTISIATLSVKRMAEISGIPADHKGWKALDELIKKALKAALPNGKFIQANNRKIDVKAPLVVEASMKMGEEWEDKLEDLENDFESALSPNGFSMPAFNELSDEIDDTGYDFYITYSICKIPVIYAISKEHPEAGAYAPCSMYMYKKEGDDTVHFGFPSVYNWISSMGIEDEASKKILIDAEEKFKNILKELTSK